LNTQISPTRVFSTQICKAQAILADFRPVKPRLGCPSGAHFVAKYVYMNTQQQKLLAIVRRHRRLLPKGWRVQFYDGRDDGVGLVDIGMTRLHGRLTVCDGFADYRQKRIVAPRPVSPYTAFVFLHELAHVVLGHLIKEHEHDAVEREATRWARKILRVAGIKGSLKRPRYRRWIKPPKLPRHRAIGRRW
jgi:hypothetical protein